MNAHIAFVMKKVKCKAIEHQNRLGSQCKTICSQKPTLVELLFKHKVHVHVQATGCNKSKGHPSSFQTNDMPQ